MRKHEIYNKNSKNITRRVKTIIIFNIIIIIVISFVIDKLLLTYGVDALNGMAIPIYTFINVAPIIFLGVTILKYRIIRNKYIRGFIKLYCISSTFAGLICLIVALFYAIF